MGPQLARWCRFIYRFKVTLKSICELWEFWTPNIQNQKHVMVGGLQRLATFNQHSSLGSLVVIRYSGKFDGSMFSSLFSTGVPSTHTRRVGMVFVLGAHKERTHSRWLTARRGKLGKEASGFWNDNEPPVMQGILATMIKQVKSLILPL